METKVCVWIDKKNAFIVFWGGETAELKPEIKYSSPYKRRLTDRREFGNDFPNKPVTNTMDLYYDQVAEQILHADSIFLFGPQTSKDELNYRLTLKRLVASDTHEFAQAV